jgi:hypothetical protein
MEEAPNSIELNYLVLLNNELETIYKEAVVA